MGEIADMVLEGILDEETGEYIGDLNEEIYGTPNPGFPISYEGETCLICDKKVKRGGLLQHMQSKHLLPPDKKEKKDDKN